MKLVTVLVSAALLAGCGSTSICQTAQTAWSNFNAKSQPCGYAPYSFDRQSCDASVKACSGQDEDTARSFYDCLDKVGTCNPQNADAWTNAVAACGIPTLSTVECTAAAQLNASGVLLCGYADSTWQLYNQDSAPCGYPAVNFSVTSCYNGVASCSADDHSIVTSYFGCLNGVGVCDPNNSTPWADAVNGCGNPTVSNTVCQSAVNPQ